MPLGDDPDFPAVSHAISRERPPSFPYTVIRHSGPAPRLEALLTFLGQSRRRLSADHSFAKNPACDPAASTFALQIPPISAPLPVHAHHDGLPFPPLRSALSNVCLLIQLFSFLPPMPFTPPPAARLLQPFGECHPSRQR